MQVRPTTWRTWDPFTALARLDRELDAAVGRSGGAPVASTFVPAVEVVREGEDVLVRFELPGVDVEDLSIEVERGRLVVAGERRDRAGDGQTVLVRELRYGRFRREFALPQGVSPEQVEASYDAGMLDVRVRAVVKPEPQPVRVPVSVGGARPSVVEHEQQAVEAAEPQPAA